ncbi:hypothetical protein ABZP36_027179 [Zizania latifolia]
MEISATTSPYRPLLLLLRPLASSSPISPATSTTTTIRRRSSASATATVRRRARTRPRTRRSKPPSDAGGSFFGDDGDDGPFGPGGGGDGGGGWWNRGSGSGSGSGAGWDSSEPDVPAPRRSAAEAALGVVYELMCLIALSNCTQFAVRRLAGLLAARAAALRFVPTVC